MADFYTMLSRWYDVLFPGNAAAVGFLTGGLDDGAHVLDLACGTGTYALALAGRGFQVEGVDFDASMIDLAKEKAAHAEVSFAAADMLDIGSLFRDRRFDLIYSVGNSIVHLPDRAAVASLIRKCRELLAADGSLVFQIVNFDRVLDYGVTTLPPLNRSEHGVSLTRTYEISKDGSSVDFVTALSVDGAVFDNRVRLLALRQSEIAEMFADAGFARTEWFGGFDGAPFEKASSPALIVRGRLG